MNALVLQHRFDVLNAINEKATSFGLHLVTFFTRLPWLIALIPVFVIGFLYTAISYLPLYVMRKLVTSKTKSILSEIAKLSPRQAMLLHADFEELACGMERVVKNGSGFFILKPVINEIAKMAVQYKKIEISLKQVAYPTSELTEDQKQNLRVAFKSWEERDSIAVN